MPDQFAFLLAEWPQVYEAAGKAQDAAFVDPRTACFYARRALELALGWAFTYDRSLQRPYQDNLSALIHEPTFKNSAGEAIFGKARLINTLGNRAVHGNRPIHQSDAFGAVRDLFHVGYWLARTYGRSAKPAAALTFDESALPRSAPVPAQTAAQLQALQAQLASRDSALEEAEKEKATLDAEIARLRKEVAAAKAAAAEIPDTHDYSETETRNALIDLLLAEAGWTLENKQDREFAVAGMPEGKTGSVDYVLWGDDGVPLALVEAKRTRRSARDGQHQAKLYADCLQARFGRRPVIFCSNGYESWIWDDLEYPPRLVQGFYTKAELELLVQRRTSRKPLATAPINIQIVERYYQTRAIRRIAESFEVQRQRKALVVMATGAGKTRAVIALCDLLMRCNWAKRVLFLADRRALVKQAVNAFKTHLPEAVAVNLLTDPEDEGRVFVSTYPTMMGQINELSDGRRRFGPGYFDLVVVDEAHRSVYQKYRAIFEYFDSLLVGLTATPKDEVDINTYSLFDVERGVPTDAYNLDEAVKDGFLVPFRAVSVPLRFPLQGIIYDELPEDEQERWDEIEWDEDGTLPDHVEAEAVNKWLFNADTVDKMLAHLMERGLTVAGGDRLGKTIVFAKNQRHAEFIAKRFDENYPHLRGHFAQVIHHGVSYAESLIDDFSNPAKDPHIAISVDMLDTGIDVPEVVNLVFAKLVRSKTKFWQMIGRGTRLRRDLFGPGRDKEFFYVFDYCRNLEFFSQNPQTTEGRLAESLSTRLFRSRLDLVGELDAAQASDDVPVDMAAEPVATYGADPMTDLRDSLIGTLRDEVAAMNPENFIVRPKRALVERFSHAEAWHELADTDRTALSHEVAGLPSQLPVEDEEAKRFDLLVLRTQLAILRVEPGFPALRDRIREIAALLEEKRSIPAVGAEIELILDVQEDEWWADVTLVMLERVRKRLRNLVRLIDKVKRLPVYSDFEDLLGAEVEIVFTGLGVADSFERFKAKARHFLRAHEDQLAIHKLRTNQPLTPVDIQQLESILLESGVATPEQLQAAVEQSQGLGVFVRSLVGLDREAAKHAFAGFLADQMLTANQIEFMDLVINHLTDHGVMPASLVYGSPFTDLAPHGPDSLFNEDQVDQLIHMLDQVRAKAEAA